MTLCRTRLGIGLLSVFLACQALRGGDEPPAESAAATPVGSPEQVRQWIVGLDDDKFRVREQATRSLIEAGVPAVDAVAEAAASDSQEVVSRAFLILKKWHSSDDDAVKTAATAALEKLAASADKGTAERAAEIISPPEQEAPGAQIVPGIGQFQIQIGAAAGNLAVTRKVDANGTKTIHVKKDGSEVEIVESPKEGISMSITETVEGKKKTTNYKAKDAAELKKKHPEAYQWYKDYAANGQARIGMGRIQIFQGGVPLAIPGRAAQLPKAGQEIEGALSDLAHVIEQLKEAAQTGADAETAKKLAEQLEAASKKLATAKEILGIGDAAPAPQPEKPATQPEKEDEQE